MKKKILIIIFVVITVISLKAQTFEGYVVYENAVESKNINIANEQVLAMVGSIQKSFYNKKGDYLNAIQGGMVRMQYYQSYNNTLYNLFTSNDTLYSKDATLNNDLAVDYVITKKIEKINGLDCDEIKITSKNTIITYYYTSKYPIEPSLYQGHKFGNWYYAVSKTKALPLKMIIETPQFILTSTIVEIKEEKINPTIFEIPKNVIIVPARW